MRAARIHADQARQRADQAARDADAAACVLWSQQMEGFGGPAQPSPTIAQALNGGYEYLEVQCKRCETRTSIPLEHVRRPKDTPIRKLEASMSCRQFAPFMKRRPRTNLIKLTATRETTSYKWHHPLEEDGHCHSCYSSPHESGSSMTQPQAPQPSSIPNVFGLHEPQHMLTKLIVEVNKLITSSSVWSKNEPYPEPLFDAYNVAVTAWHITDWLWMSSPATRQLLAKRYGFEFNESTQAGLDTGLARFQKAVRVDCRPLDICEEIANASKHMRRRNNNPDIKAVAEWHPVIEPAGNAKVGDRVMDLSIYDGDKKIGAEYLFIQAMDYWERLMRDNDLIKADAVLPQKIIKE